MCFWPHCIEYVIKKESRSKIKLIVTLQNYIYSEHHPSLPMTVQQDATKYSLLYFCKLLYTFWVVTPPIIRDTIVITASGTGQTVSATFCCREEVGTALRQRKLAETV
jgi:hypothetical protein